MVNMSYCHFENTLLALRECLDDVQEHVEEYADYPTSARETERFRMMVHEFVDFLNENGLLDEYNDVDEAALDDVVEKMQSVN